MNIIPLDAPRRSLAEAKADHVAPYLTTPFYLVMIEPKHGKPYPVEMNWEAMINRELTLQEVIECSETFIHGQKIYVFRYVPGAAFENVTEEFAHLYARRMAEDGYGYSRIRNVPFLSLNLLNSDILELTQGR